MERTEYRYYAFISYSHKDQEIAKRLQKTLHRYHLPSKVLKSNPDLPKKLAPVFLDDSNLVAVGPLDESLRRNLDDSKYLIVLCSPNSAQSRYVNDEVKYFIDSKKLAQIVPLIVDGEPYSDDPAEESFPQAIRDLPRNEELLGINMKKFGERGAFLRVIATLLGLNLEHFVDDEDIRRKRKIFMFSAIAAVFMIAAGLLIWQNIPHEHYYHSYVYQWGKPVGLFEVKSESDRMKMEYTYRFTVLRGKVQKIERVNSAGILVNPTVPAPFTELPMICFVSDRVVEYYDLYRHKIYRQEYTKNMQAVDFYCGDGDVPYALPSDTMDFHNPDEYDYNSIAFSLNKNGNITRMTLEYDKNGYIIKQTFRRDNHGGKDKKGTPAQDVKGRWGFRYTLDDIGRIISIHNLDKNGNDMPVRGVYAEHIDYGGKPYPVKITHTGKNGKPVLYEAISIQAVVYDEYFNVMKISYYDEDEKRVLNTASNIHEINYTHDPDNGFLTSESYYDDNSVPCLRKSGCFRVEYDRNKEGRVTRKSYYDIYGERTVCSDGYASMHSEYNDDGQELSVTYTNTENNPAVDFSVNVYGYKVSYEDGFATRFDFVDSHGNLMLCKNGYASMIFTYNKDENKIASITYKDTECNRVLNYMGVAEERITYEDGNWSSIKFYDEDGLPVDVRAGVAKWVSEWKNGNMTSIKYFDSADKLKYRIDFEYDENGLKICERYYDADGKQRILEWGHSAVKYVYDDRGNMTGKSYHDANDDYITVKTHVYLADEDYCTASFYAQKFEYYDNGKVKHIQLLGEENSVSQDMYDNQVKDVYLEYDSRGNETKRYWLNGKGEEVDSEGGSEGPVRIEKEYDVYGRVKKAFAYTRGEERPKAMKEYEYDSFGREISRYGVMYTGGSKDIGIIKKEYDQYGNCCKKYYLNSNNELMIPANSLNGANSDYAVRKARHDIFGHETDVLYYDEKEEPLSSEKRAFHTVRTYDSKGNILTESYYNDENEEYPAEISGIYKILRKYDASGNETERRLLNANGDVIQKQD